MSLPEAMVYNNPDPGQVRAIKDGLAYFSNRVGTRWEAFFEGYLVGVASDKAQAIEFYQAARNHKDRRMRP